MIPLGCCADDDVSLPDCSTRGRVQPDGLRPPRRHPLQTDSPHRCSWCDRGDVACPPWPPPFVNPAAVQVPPAAGDRGVKDPSAPSLGLHPPPPPPPFATTPALVPAMVTTGASSSTSPPEPPPARYVPPPPPASTMPVMSIRVRLEIAVSLPPAARNPSSRRKPPEQPPRIVLARPRTVLQSAHPAREHVCPAGSASGQKSAATRAALSRGGGCPAGFARASDGAPSFQDAPRARHIPVGGHVEVPLYSARFRTTRTPAQGAAHATTPTPSPLMTEMSPTTIHWTLNTRISGASAWAGRPGPTES